MNKPKIDVQVANHGTIFLFKLNTRKARKWVKEFVRGNETMFWGGALVVEHGYAQDLAQGMMNDGLNVA